MQMPLDQNKLILNYLNNLLNTPDKSFDWRTTPDVETLVFP
jgi:hypothetical protein